MNKQKRIFRSGMLSILLAAVLAACSGNREEACLPSSPETYPLTEVLLKLDAGYDVEDGGTVQEPESRTVAAGENGSFQVRMQESSMNPAQMRNTRELLPGELTPEQEQAVRDVCVFQFDAETGLLKYKKYFPAPDEDTENVKAVHVLLRTDVPRFHVCVLANVGDVTGSFNVDRTTMSEYRKSRKPALPDSGCVLEGVLPMSAGTANGSAGAPISNTSIPEILELTATRMVTKIRVNLTSSYAALKVLGLSLENVPEEVTLHPPGEGEKTDITGLSYRIGAEKPEIGADGKFSYIWYVPENIQGAGTVAESGIQGWKDRHEGTAPQGATYIQVFGIHKNSEGMEEGLLYNVYLGKPDEVNDFSVPRNASYTADITINGADEADKRILPVISLSGEGYANCYLTSRPETLYLFDGTVRGNGAATPADISPTGEALEKNAAMTPKHAELVWETNGPKKVIREIRHLSAGYVIFKTGEDTEGNAVIAVKDGNGEDSKILWSWHIWHTHFNLKVMNESHIQTYQTVPRSVAGHKNLLPRDLRVMDRNLGAASNEAVQEGAEKTFGLNWQWGRKDPFLGAKAINSSTLESGYDKDGTEISHSDWIKRRIQSSNCGKTPSQNVAYSVEHPDWYITATGADNHWVYNSNANVQNIEILWGCRNGDSGLFLDFTYTGKTIYDPCPAGWCVAPPDTWIGFTTSPQLYDPVYSGPLYVNSPDNTKYTNWSQAPYYGRRFYVNNQKELSFYSSSGHLRNAGFTGIWSCHTTSGFGKKGIVKPAILVNALEWVSSTGLGSEHAPSAAFSIRCVREEDALANKHLE